MSYVEKHIELLASIIRANGRFLAFQAENQGALFVGNKPPHGKETFDNVVIEEGIDYNSVISKLYH